MTATETEIARARRQWSKRGSFWAAAAVLALCLWASGAPSTLYPSYAAEWDLSPVVTTSIFGTYPVALLLVLLLAGGISDSIGRRRAMLVGVGLIVASAFVFAIAPNVSFLFAGRALQGVGTGFALGAASAALVENNLSKNPRFASVLTTVSTSTGLTLVLFVSGGLAQYAPWPLQLSFWVLFVLAGLAFAVVWFMRRDNPPRAVGPDGKPARWKPSGIHMPRSLLRTFIASTLGVIVAYSVGAIFLSLGASMARDLTGTTNLLIVGALLAISSVVIGVTALLLQKVPAHVSLIVGAVISLAGLGVMELTAAQGSIALFVVWCVVGGAGYSFVFTGGLTLLNRTALPEHRGGTLSLLYLFSYLLQAITAVVAGALATALGLNAAIDLVAPGVAVLCLALITATTVDVVARRREARLVGVPAT
ncbi:Predicted arabinose efflux permease, MFS family [Agreia bicolorata]|uniref:Predicted arabinose efflux permease, MFS family n=1 Tax=Agreia bicolorata TaxID=110935 RepID=A0A1T4XLC4_9MICO|nr:MFS transporter [Agreia bicolorata]SKA89871.1 Predicted arabinose efflux permease, MFS family [Agreia bicolorata]